MDFPVAGIQLHGIFALIFDGYFIGKGKMNLVVFEVRTFKTSQDRNLYAAGYL
ncbi:hypothetical protein FCR2A7T_15380 [Flavobacterium cauense R2A-7]|nr:hypothetical protein FCR2A7T_15380 [Flavobacterium cauense R2A-7]